MFTKLATVVAAGALAFTTLVAAQEDPRCQGNSGEDSHPWTDVYYIGSKDMGTQFCHTQQTNGITITGIEVWADKSDVNALQFHYSDGSSSDTIGTQDGESKRMDWDYTKERVKQAKLWGNGKGTALGKIQIVLGNDDNPNTNSLVVGKETDGQQTFDIKTNSGILLGAYGGYSNKQIRGLGLLFLKSKIKSQVLENMDTGDTPEDLNAKMAGIKKMTTQRGVYSLDFANTTAMTIFAADEARSNTHTWTTTTGHTVTLGGSWSVKGSFLGIADVTSTYSLQYAVNHEDSSSKEEGSATTFKYSINVNAKNNQTIYCRATSMYGEYKADWTGTMAINLEDGSAWRYQTTGSVEQTLWAQVEAGCQEKPFPNDAEDAPPIHKRAIQYIS